MLRSGLGSMSLKWLTGVSARFSSRLPRLRCLSHFSHITFFSHVSHLSPLQLSFAACVGICTAASFYGNLLTPNASVYCLSDRLNLSELRDELRRRLKPARLKLKSRGSATPDVLCEDQGGTHSVTIPLSSSYDFPAILRQCIKLLGGGDVKVHSTSSHAGYEDTSFVNESGTASILFRNPEKGLGELPQVSVYKDGGFTAQDVATLVEAYTTACANTHSAYSKPKRSQSYGFDSPGGLSGSESGPVAELQALGVYVYDKNSNLNLNWDSLAGYDEVKQQVQDTVVNALAHPHAYDSIARLTRERFESNRPRAVLFEGPPGTGKTLTARILASRCDVTMVHVPVERIVSKWYGESEQNLRKIFDLCDSLEGGCIIFIDEVDALATSRGANTHEATRRLLSVVLQHIEGFKTNAQEDSKRSVVVCATNRKDDLDAALLSRFDVTVRFDLPSTQTRASVYKRYAKHLSQSELQTLAEQSHGMSCRDIKEVCENAERRWASKQIRGEKLPSVPGLTQYSECVLERRRTDPHTQVIHA